MNENDDIPIRGLADLESPVSARFLSIFRSKIYRRTATAQLAHFSFSLPIAIFVEFLSIIGHLFAVIGGRKDKTR
jgi:hypothetical protein